MDKKKPSLRNCCFSYSPWRHFWEYELILTFTCFNWVETCTHLDTRRSFFIEQLVYLTCFFEKDFDVQFVWSFSGSSGGGAFCLDTPKAVAHLLCFLI